METYYANRAAEYERIYRREDPTRQAELEELAAGMTAALTGRTVLELACGTGYWTAIACGTVKHITATDVTTEVLDIASAKALPASKVVFRTADAYRPELVEGSFDAGLANFWLSHVPKSRLREFLEAFHRKLGTGSVVFMADNMNVPGIGGELIEKHGDENTYKLRTLDDGTTYEIMKNYFTETELMQLFTPYATDLHVEVRSCFWWVCYRIK